MVKVRIDEILEKLGKSRYWLAKKTGLTELTISRLVKRRTSGIDFETLDKICGALECEPGDVFDYSSRDKGKKVAK